MVHHLLLSLSRPSLLKPVLSTPSLRNLIKWYSQSKDQDDHAIGEKAPSTAEEFSRVAKEKAESVSQTAKEAWEGAKEAVGGGSDSESAKHKYKANIEKGNYDKMGQD